MAFERILVVGAERFDGETRRVLESMSRAMTLVDGPNVPKAGYDDVDALMVSLGVAVPAEVMEAMPKLRYIGLFGTNLAPIDRAYCRAQGITVTNVVGYCDRETAEFCLIQAMMALRGIGALGSRPGVSAKTVQGKRLGVVGVGAVGRELALMAQGVGMKVCYAARTRKRDLEELGLERREPVEVLRRVDLVSLHLPPTLQLLDASAFELLPVSTPLLNTCLGLPYDVAALEGWLERGGNLIVDHIASAPIGDLAQHPRVTVIGVAAYATRESIARRREIFIGQARNFLTRTR